MAPKRTLHFAARLEVSFSGGDISRSPGLKPCCSNPNQRLEKASPFLHRASHAVRNIRLESMQRAIRPPSRLEAQMKAPISCSVLRQEAGKVERAAPC